MIEGLQHLPEGSHGDVVRFNGLSFLLHLIDNSPQLMLTQAIGDCKWVSSQTTAAFDLFTHNTATNSDPCYYRCLIDQLALILRLKLDGSIDKP